MRLCKTEDCGGKYEALGYCQKHYVRFKKYGDPLYVKSKRFNEGHGMHGTSEYRSWYQMLQHCYNPNSDSHKSYGGKGIVVCKSWQDGFKASYIDMGDKPFQGAQIDRENNGLGHHPSNCHWATCTQNNRNKSNIKLNMLKALETRRKYSEGNITMRELSMEYNVNISEISKVVSHVIWNEVA